MLRDVTSQGRVFCKPSPSARISTEATEDAEPVDVLNADVVDAVGTKVELQ